MKDNDLSTAKRRDLALRAGRTETYLPAASFIVPLIAWQAAVQLGWLNPFFFSSPTRVARAGWDEVRDPSFLNDIAVSSTEFAVGYVAAIIVGVAFGIIIGWYRKPHLFFDPWLMAFNAMPRIALLPLVVLWVGLGIWSKIVIVFLGVFFPMAINVFHGVRTVDRTHLQVARSFGASERFLFLTVIIPSIIPFITTGARIGVGRAVAGVTIGEFYSAQAGLAHRIFQAGLAFEIDRMIFGTIVITLLAMGVYRLVAWVDRRVVQRRGTLKMEDTR